MVMEKSENLNRLSERKSFAIPPVETLPIFSQTTISRSQGNFSEIREKSEEMKVGISVRPVWQIVQSPVIIRITAIEMREGI